MYKDEFMNRTKEKDTSKYFNENQPPEDVIGISDLCELLQEAGLDQETIAAIMRLCNKRDLIKKL